MTNYKNVFMVPAQILIGAATVALSLLFMSIPSLAQADTLDRQLEVGMTGSDVSALQTFLAQDKTLYPQGLVTGYFGFLTKSAVSNFQSRNSITNVGRVGPITLIALNAQISGSPVSGADVTVPIILSGVNVNTTQSGASISWTTNEPTQGQVYYDTAPIQADEATGPHQVPPISGSLAIDKNGVQMNHSIQLQSLQPNTLYYYLLRVTDNSGNISITWPPATFRTNQ